MADKGEKRGAAYAMFGLNEPEQRDAGTAGATPSSPAGTPQYVYVQGPPPGGGSSLGKAVPWLLGALLVLSVVNLALVLYTRSDARQVLSKQSDQLNVLTRRMDASDERYAQLRGQFQVTRERLGLTQQELSRARDLAAGIQKEQQKTVQQLNAAIAQKASGEELNKVATDANTRIGNLSGDLAGTRKDLEATKEALTGAKGELSGAIARTHDDLVALAHRSDRDYFEFSLPRKHARQKVGRVMVELIKTDTKRNLFSLNLLFDDKRTERKDKAVDEPVYFYVQGASSALELVVNKVGKDSVQGYMSTPKGLFPETPSVISARPGS